MEKTRRIIECCIFLYRSNHDPGSGIKTKQIVVEKNVKLRNFCVSLGELQPCMASFYQNLDSRKIYKYKEFFKIAVSVFLVCEWLELTLIRV